MERGSLLAAAWINYEQRNDNEKSALQVAARPSSGCSPRELAPSLELLGTQIEHVSGRLRGYLVLVFSNGWSLTIGSTEFG